MARPRGLALLFVVGAVVGSFFDGFHTHSGATRYPHPVVFAMAWWTPLVFGTAFVLVALTYSRFVRPSEPPVETARVAAGFVAFGALYFMSGYLPASNVVKLALLVLGSALLYAFVDRSRAALATGLIAAVVGPAFELGLTQAGYFAHLSPDFLGLPIWLPGLYLASGPGIGALAAWFVGAREIASSRRETLSRDAA